ncbi:carbohydrate binding domain-containing protein [bacterium]|nr:carbohydrate binding domain-containing protein [bacterium]
MNKIAFTLFIVIVLFVVPLSITPSCTDKSSGSINPDFPTNKWVYIINTLTTTEKLNDAKSIASTAKKHGLNGVVLAGHLDAISRWKPDRIENLKKFKKHCDDIGIELIPQLFSVGYGGSVLGHNPNLAAGMPFVDIPFIVDGSTAYPDIGKANLIKNPGFEISISNHNPRDYKLIEKANEIVFIDKKIKHSGSSSVRLENFALNEHGHGRIAQGLKLKVKTEYIMSIWVKTENISPVESLRVQIFKPDLSGSLPSSHYGKRPKSTQDWTEYTFRFYSGNAKSAIMYFGTWAAQSGKVWIDDLKLVEATAAQDVIIRPGTPLTVKSADKEITYKEGIDYKKIPGLTELNPHGTILKIELTTRSAISNGENLLVSGYSAARIRNAKGGYQVGLCMSEPALYDYWEEQVELLYPILKMDKAFLSMDEIRTGGACEACRSRNMTMGEILGDCVTRQMKLLRRFNPEMEIYCWSDMFNPNANARDNYFLAYSTFEKSWEHVPKDLIMVCWIYKYRRQSLMFFSENGFRTMGSPYYDRKSLDDTKKWYDELARTSGSMGIMYTTWKNDYSFLEEFGDYLSDKSQ